MSGTCTRWTWSGRTRRASPRSCCCRREPRGRKGAPPWARSRSWPTTCSRRDSRHDGCALVRLRLLPSAPAPDPRAGRQAGPRRPRPRRQGGRRRAPRRGDGGGLHRTPPDARDDRHGGGAGGRRRGRSLDSVGRAHDPLSAGPAAARRDGPPRHAGHRRRHHPCRRHGGAPGARHRAVVRPGHAYRRSHRPTSTSWASEHLER